MPGGLGGDRIVLRGRVEREPERVALGIAADRPRGTRVDHAPAEFADRCQRGIEIGDLEVGQRVRVTRATSALVHAEHGAGYAVGLPAAALAFGAVVELETEDARPEPPSPLGIVSRELDQRQLAAHG